MSGPGRLSWRPRHPSSLGSLPSWNIARAGRRSLMRLDLERMSYSVPISFSDDYFVVTLNAEDAGGRVGNSEAIKTNWS